MVFKANETAPQIKHFGLRLSRVLLGRKRDHYLSRFNTLNVPVVSARDLDGTPYYCHHCGYDMIAVTLDNDWTLETCSAMPILLLSSPLFAAWKKRVPAEKLPMARV